MPRRAWRGLGFLGGAVLCFLAFWAGAGWSDGYAIHYAGFPPSRGELALKLYSVLFILPGMCLLAAAMADLAPTALLRAFNHLGTQRAHPLWAVTLALFVLAAVVNLRLWVLLDAPITDDENVYQFQAQLIASGRLYRDSLPESVRPFFDNQFIVNDGRWYGLYFIGHSILLAAADRVGALKLLGPAEAALTLLLAIGIARRIFGERAALLSGLLLASSPFFLFVSATHLSQPTAALCLMLFIYAALRIEDSPGPPGWWALAALALAFGVLTRPQTAVFLAAPFLARLGLLGWRKQIRPGWAGPLSALAILGLGGAAFLSVNLIRSGGLLRTGYQAYMTQGHAWPFPVGPWPTLREISQNIAQMNFWLFGWPVSLAFLPFFRRSSRAWALAAVPAVAFLWYGIVAVPTVAAVGPVYYAETIAPLVVLSASGFEQVVLRLRQDAGAAWLGRALIAVPMAGVLASLAVFVPVQIASLRPMARLGRAPYALVERARLDHALVFVRGWPAARVLPGTWVLYHRNPRPDLDDAVLFVRWLGPEKNAELMRYFPDRAPFAMDVRGDTLTLTALAR